MANTICDEMKRRRKQAEAEAKLRLLLHTTKIKAAIKFDVAAAYVCQLSGQQFLNLKANE